MIEGTTIQYVEIGPEQAFDAATSPQNNLFFNDFSPDRSEFLGG
jgi:hypothetical protein